MQKSSEWKSNVRKKFRIAIARFFRKLKKTKPLLKML